MPSLANELGGDVDTKWFPVGSWRGWGILIMPFSKPGGIENQHTQARILFCFGPHSSAMVKPQISGIQVSQNLTAILLLAAMIWRTNVNMLEAFGALL